MNIICPDDVQLVDFLGGLLETELHDSVATHIDSCDGCQQRIVNQSPAALSVADSDVFKDEAEKIHLISRLKSISLDKSGSPVNDCPPGEMPSLKGFDTNDVIGRGGMGVVYSAKDHELDRQVAVKLMSRSTTNLDSRKRFINEAKITGQLEHPGIVPIYRMREDGERPWYAMRLIRGNSLHDEAKRFHKSAPSQDSANASTGISPQNAWQRCPRELRSLLRRFCEVCNAVAFAHSQGILHRDLKPANIMLGEFGETLVIDWGLAKRISDDESKTESHSKADSNVTRDDQLIGTPDFMSPEQAMGSSQELGPASDVYSLGSTLYFLLTGSTPYKKNKDSDEVLDRVRDGKFVALRAVNPRVPKPLEAICVRAMSIEPDQRYSGAKELAADVERFLADEPVTAHSEPMIALMGRWMRKNPTPVIATAVALLIVLLSATGLAAVVSSKNRALAEANGRLDEANGELKHANEALTHSNRAERKAKDEATRQAMRRANILEFFERNILATARPVEQAGGLGIDTSIRDAVDHAESNIAGRFKEDPLTEAEIRLTIGSSYVYLGEPDLAIEQLKLGLELAEQELESSDSLILSLKQRMSEALKDAGNLEQAFSVQQTVVNARQTELGLEHEQTLAAEHALAEILINRGQLQEALTEYEDLYSRAQAILVAEDPVRLTIANGFAQILYQSGRYDESLPLLENVLKTRRRTLDRANPTLMASISNYGQAIYKLGRVKESVPLFEEMAELSRENLGPTHSLTLRHANNLGRVLRRIGRLEQAVSVLQLAADDAEQKLGNGHILTITLKSSYADALASADKILEAVDAKKVAVAGAQSALGNDHPTTLDVTGGLANLLLYSAGQDKEALLILQELLPRARSKFGEEHPKTLKMQQNLGIAFHRTGKLDEAIPMLEQVLHVRRKIFPEHHPFIIESLSFLPTLYLESDRDDEAFAMQAEQIKSFKIAYNDRHSLIARQLENAARNLYTHEHYERAIPWLRECIEMREEHSLERLRTANLRSLLGVSLGKTGKPNEAKSLLLAAFEELAAEDDPSEPIRQQTAEAALRLAEFYESQDNLDQAQHWRDKANDLW